MTQTLRRKLVKIIYDTLENYYDDIQNKEIAGIVADAILELRAFSKTDHEQPKYDVSRAGLDWVIAAGKPIEQEQLDSAKLEKEAQDTFERDMLFNPLPWNSTQEWQKFGKFVVKEYQKDRLIFAKYKTWQQNEGKFVALSNRKIKAKPQDFIDCFPDFLAHSSMYGRKANQETELDSSGAPYSY